MLSPKIEKMLVDAVLAGWQVTRKNNMVYIAKYTRHKKPRLIDGIAIFPDGEAIRMGVDLTICTGIKTVKAMRKFLELSIR